MSDLKARVEIDAAVSGKEKVDGIAASVDALGKEARQSFAEVSSAEKQAQTATEQLEGAFSKLGIRSAAKIQADILAVNQALIKLAASGKVSGEEFDRAFAAGQAQIRRFRSELDGAAGAADGIREHADGLITLFSRLGLAFSGAELARQFLTVNVELERMQRTFTAIGGSSQKAAEEMAYAREVADRLGLPIITVGKAYADLTAATKGTRVEGQATRDVFEAVSQAMSVAGKTADDTQGALLALSQMASKGAVSMEELRGQLGERLPGALNAVAAGFGITTAQLIKLVESGNLTAEQLFPALTKGLNDLYGAQSASGQQTETLAQRWEHLKNAIADTFKTIGDAGVIEALKIGLQRLEAATISASVGIVAAGKNLGIFAAAVANGEIGMNGFGERATAAFAEVAKEAQDKLVAAARHNQYLEQALDASGRAALSAARAHKQVGAAAAQAGTDTGAAGIAITRLNVTYGELAERSEKAAKQAKASADARKAETDASVNLASALGTERDQLLAKEEATRTNAEAARRLAVETAADLSLNERHLAGLKAEIATRGQASEAEQKQIDALQLLVNTKRAESDAASGQAQSAAIAAAAAQTAVAAYADNSLRVNELAAAYDLAKVAVEELTAMQAEDIALTPQLEEAKTKAAAAGKLYRDALEDQTRAIERNAMVKQSQMSVDQAAIRLAIEQQRTILEVARVRGDERTAVQALLEMKRLEIKLAELLAQAKKAEADSILAAVQAKREELRASGQLTAAKEAEINAQEAGARVKQVEAEIAAETAKRLQELADAAFRAGGEAGSMGNSFRKSSEDLGTLGDAADRATQKIDRLKDSAGRPSPNLSGNIQGTIDRGGINADIQLRQQDKELTVQQLRDMNLTAREIEDYYGNRRLSQADQAAGLVSRNVSTQAIDYEQIARQQGFTGQAVKAFVAAFSDLLPEEMAALQTKLRNVAVTSTEGYLTEYSGAFERAKQRAAEAARQSATREAQAQAPASVHRVEIVFAGKTVAVDTASPDAAQALIGTLKELKSRAA